LANVAASKLFCKVDVTSPTEFGDFLTVRSDRRGPAPGVFSRRSEPL